MGLPIWDNSIDSSENYIRTKISMNDWLTRTGADILRELQDIGLGIREKDFYSIRRDVLNIAVHQQEIERLDQTHPIPFGYMDKQPTWKLKRDYVYQLKYTYTIGDDPTEYEEWYSVSSDQRLSKETIEDNASEDLTELAYHNEQGEITITGVGLKHVYTKRARA